jgi:hypothetical protein
MAQTR